MLWLCCFLCGGFYVWRGRGDPPKYRASSGGSPITHGAYGIVTRAKAIFDVNDGRSLYCDFVSGVPQTDFLELNLPRYLEGRPQRFSGIEIAGKNLNETALKATLSDCCLSESMIFQYQQQVQQILLEGQQV